MRERGQSRAAAAQRPVETGYEAPAIKPLGTLFELTLYCDKELGHSDGFTFMGAPIVCATSV
jgi:hypothetical protein